MFTKVNLPPTPKFLFDWFLRQNSIIRSALFDSALLIASFKSSEQHATASIFLMTVKREEDAPINKGRLVVEGRTLGVLCGCRSRVPVTAPFNWLHVPNLCVSRYEVSM